MAEGNDIPMLPAYQAERQFIQEILSLEDTDEDFQAEGFGDALEEYLDVLRRLGKPMSLGLRLMPSQWHLLTHQWPNSSRLFYLLSKITSQKKPLHC